MYQLPCMAQIDAPTKLLLPIPRACVKGLCSPIGVFHHHDHGL